MGAFVNPRGGPGGRRSRRAMSEINVTPFVDVMLVLLIIFMVTAPLLTTGVEVDLPKADAPALREPDRTAVTVFVDAQGRVHLQETAMEMDEMLAKLKAVRDANPDGNIYVKGDKAIDYGRVMEVMGRLYSAGFTKVALVTDPVSGRPATGAPQPPPRPERPRLDRPGPAQK